jgi:hypothetical protein
VTGRPVGVSIDAVPPSPAAAPVAEGRMTVLVRGARRRIRSSVGDIVVLAPLLGIVALLRVLPAYPSGSARALALALVSAVLVWMLARRLRLPRWAAAVAVGLFALSPLAVRAHAVVGPEPLAVPFLLAGSVLLLGPRRRVGAVGLSGASVAAAVLLSWVALLLVPALAMLLRRTGREHGGGSSADHEGVRRERAVWLAVVTVAGSWRSRSRY